MATYKEEHGTGIVKVTTDPTNPVNGQVWYNSTDQALKGFTSNPVGSWSTGGSLNTARYWASSSGSQTDALAFGGFSTASSALNEAYNGTSWTEVNDLNNVKIIADGVGTSTSSLSFLGSGPPPTSTYIALNESWNGTSWTEVGDLNTARRQAGGAGADSTSALGFGGETPPQGDTGITELWNGSSWTEVADLNTARGSLDGGPMGTATAALAAGGFVYNPSQSPILKTENYNGTTWTELNDPDSVGDGRFGDPSSAILHSGTDVQLWNGTSWAETTGNSNNLTARTGTGTTSAGLLIGGESPASSATEEWVSPTTTTVTFTTT